MERIPEPELMDDPGQARAYAEADFAEVNAGFVEGFQQSFPWLGGSPFVLDLGCGPGDIPLRLARAMPGALVQAVDGSPAMIELAREAVAGTEEEPRVMLVQSGLRELEPPPMPFHAVVSNSLLHHLHHGADLWRTIQRVAGEGTAIYVMDLQRPDSEERAAAIVDQYAADEPEQLRTDFYNSLLAAFTPEEVGDQLRAAGLEGLEVETVSDRHLLVTGTL
ncbi:methyltransferase type 12 [Thiohalorhabdus denitrificans]|uniref:Ubiquinone/menaquinone biosynthesis C-methylase UbiE n=1 Tax=Thiohalorhabdus denitrificans TaxID=381306 RepID=A0A0P9EBF2_9GAMM|nr:class I SAM-dependent methyltransferase [Thiohalorhabdus denitrificans]KPV39602.1 methyltransferase type 12 [Thiohalorhabdus denitrificans]SCX97105.1 Ubiquinone/menaquinone biosynthesis C-methylase UbiE [Thiohalorhabdus denitrificans]